MVWVSIHAEEIKVTSVRKLLNEKLKINEEIQHERCDQETYFAHASASCDVNVSVAMNHGCIFDGLVCSKGAHDDE
jgi:hypothetical protein